MEKNRFVLLLSSIVLLSGFVSGPALHALSMVPLSASDTIAAERLQDFSEGLAGICRDGIWGYINASGKQVIRCIYSGAGKFSNKLAPVRVDTKWGYIDHRGSFVVNPRFDEAMPFSEGLAAVRQGTLWGVIDTRGKMVQDYSYEGLKGFCQGLAPAMRLGKWGYIDREGTFVIRRTWADAGEFREGLAPVKDLEGQWGFIDQKGDLYVDPQFDEAGHFSEGLAPVRTGNQWGYVNWKGQYVVSPQYGHAGPFSEKRAAVEINHKWGFIDPSGNIVLQAAYEKAGTYSGGLAMVETRGKAGFINLKGEEKILVIQPIEPARLPVPLPTATRSKPVVPSDSYAANAGLGLGAEVNPQTGQLDLSLKCIALPGITDGMDLNLGISRQDVPEGDNTTLFGFPPGWKWDLDYLDTRSQPRILHLTGSSSLILDDQWEPSGFRFIKGGQYRIETLSQSVKLPYEEDSRNYLYHCVSYDGRSMYFDLYGKLILTDDRFGNHIAYHYDPAEYPESSRLVKITDSYGQEILLSYEGEAAIKKITITLPDNRIASCRFYINKSDDSRIILQDPTGKNATIKLNPDQTVSSIVYPSGGSVDFGYSDNQIQYKLPGDEASHYFPAVTRVTSDPRTLGCKKMVTRYVYGSGQTYYTGAPYYDFQGNSLMTSGNNKFRFTTQVIYERSRENGDQVENHMTFNHLNLTCETRVYQQEALREVIRPVYQGQDADGDFPGDCQKLDRNYNRTVQTLTTLGRKTHNNESLAFNDLGMLSSSIQNNGTLCLKTANTYHDDHYGLLKSTVKEDNADHSQLITETTLSPDKKYIARIVTSRNGEREELQIRTLRDSKGRIVRQARTYPAKAEPSSSVISCSYEASVTGDSLTTIKTDSLGNRVAETVDVRNGRICSQTDAMGNRLFYTYEKNGLVVTRNNPDGSRVSVDNSDSSKTVTTSSSGVIETDYLDGFGRVVRKTDNRGEKGRERQISALTYNELGEVETETDLFSHVTKYIYSDWQGRKTESRDFLGNIRKTVYDPEAMTETNYFNDLPVSKTLFDEEGNEVRTIRYLDGQPGSAVYPLTEYGYNASGELVSTKLMLAADLEQPSTPVLTKSSRFDLDGNDVHTEVSTADGSFASTETFYNIYNFIGSSSTAVSGSSPGLLAQGKNQTGEIKRYDAAGRVVSVISPMGHDSVMYDYDKNGRRTLLKDHDGKVTRYVYDGMGRVISEECGSLKNTIHYFAPGTPFREGLMQSRTLHEHGKLKDSISFDYNRMGLLTTVTYLNGKKRTTTYDDYGRLRKIKDIGGTEAIITYDSVVPANVIRIENPYGSISYTYYSGKNGALFGTGSVLKEVTLSNGIRIGYEYYGNTSNGSASPKIRRIVAAGSRLSLLRLGLGILTTSPGMVLNSSPEVILVSSLFSYDERGRPSVITRTSDIGDVTLNHVKKYTYNDLDQLIGEKTEHINGDLISAHSYRYDVNGNIVSKTIKTQAAQTDSMVYRYDAENKLTGFTDREGRLTRFGYNANGSITSVMTDSTALNSFDYNDLEQLVRYTDRAGTNVGYGYNAQGLRALKKDNKTGYSITYYYDQDKQIVHEEDSDGKTASTLANLLRVEEGTALWLIGDLKDMLAAVYDKAGQRTESYSYDAYGNPGDPGPAADSSKSAFSLTTNPFRYSGYYYDQESGMYYLRSRYYHPGIMRFTSADSYDVANKYAYAGGNPVMMTDPGGHMSKWVDYGLKALGIIVGAATAAVSGGTSLVGAFAIASSTALTVSTAAQVVSNQTSDYCASEMWRKISLGFDIAGGVTDMASIGIAAGRNLGRASSKVLKETTPAATGKAYLSEANEGGVPGIRHLYITFIDQAAPNNAKITRYELFVTGKKNMDEDAFIFPKKNWKGEQVHVSVRSQSNMNLSRVSEKFKAEIEFGAITDPQTKKAFLDEAFARVSVAWYDRTYNLLEDNCRKFASDMMKCLDELLPKPAPVNIPALLPVL